MKLNLFKMTKDDKEEVLKVLFYLGWGLLLLGTFAILVQIFYSLNEERPTTDELNKMDDRQLMLSIRDILAKCAGGVLVLGAICSGSFLIKLSTFNNRNSEK